MQSFIFRQGLCPTIYLPTLRWRMAVARLPKLTLKVVLAHHMRRAGQGQCKGLSERHSLAYLALGFCQLCLEHRLRSLSSLQQGL